MTAFSLRQSMFGRRQYTPEEEDVINAVYMHPSEELQSSFIKRFEENIDAAFGEYAFVADELKDLLDDCKKGIICLTKMEHDILLAVCGFDLKRMIELDKSLRESNKTLYNEFCALQKLNLIYFEYGYKWLDARITDFGRQVIARKLIRTYDKDAMGI